MPVGTEFVWFQLMRLTQLKVTTISDHQTEAVKPLSKRLLKM
jgi:hypothetical protein